MCSSNEPTLVSSTSNLHSRSSSPGPGGVGAPTAATGSSSNHSSIQDLTKNLSNQDLSAADRPMNRELPSLDAVQQRQQSQETTPIPPQRVTSISPDSAVTSPTPSPRPLSAPHDSTVTVIDYLYCGISFSLQ